MSRAPELKLYFDYESPFAYHAYPEGEGVAALDACIEEAHADHVFGMPLFVFEGELVWGHDRMPLLEERLVAAGLARQSESERR